MSTEKLYDTIKAWRDSCDTAGLYLIAKDMDITLKQLEADMLIEQSKKSGTKSIVTAANRIIKNAQTMLHEMLWGMFINQTRDGLMLYCVSDTFVAIRFNKKPLLPEIDKKWHGREIQLEQIVKSMDGSKEIKLPDIGKLKVYIKTHKIEEKNNPKKVAAYLLDEELNLWVNPQNLLDAMECLPDCKAYAANRISPIYLKAENGDGVVMPVNHN